MNRRTQGNQIEELVARALEQRGFVVLEQNVYSQYGEVDIFAKHKGELHAIEVKYRADGAFGDAAAAVRERKLQRVYLAVRDLQQQGRLPRGRVLYSVAAVQGRGGKMVVQFFQNIGWQDVQKLQ